VGTAGARAGNKTSSGDGGGCTAPAQSVTLSVMRDREAIDSELRLLAAVRRSIREHGMESTSRLVDELLDERLARRGRVG
jgi:hypothetical protein